MFSFDGNPLTQEHEILATKIESLTTLSKAAHSEDCVILACTVLIVLQSVTDRRTPRSWLKRAKHFAVARKNDF